MTTAEAAGSVPQTIASQHPRQPAPTLARQLGGVLFADAVGGTGHHCPLPIPAQIAARPQEVGPHEAQHAERTVG